MSKTLYQLTQNLIDAIRSLGLEIHPQTCHILQSMDGNTLSIFFGESVDKNGKFTEKINIEIIQNGTTFECILFFLDGLISGCAKRKSNQLIGIDISEMEELLFPFFEMEEIKEPDS